MFVCILNENCSSGFVALSAYLQSALEQLPLLLNCRRCAVYHKAITLHVSTDHLRPFSTLQITKVNKAGGLQAVAIKLIWRTCQKAKSAKEAAKDERERIFDAQEAAQGVRARRVTGSAQYAAIVSSAHLLAISPENQYQVEVYI